MVKKKEPTDDVLEVVVRSPDYFTGVGIPPVPGTEAVVAGLKAVGIPPDRIPWMVIEFLIGAGTDETVPTILNTTSEAIHGQLRCSRLIVDSPPDPDIVLDEYFTHHFRVGPTLDMCLLLGSTTDAFKRAWDEVKLCYVEVHLWVRAKSDSAEKSMFLCTVLGNDEVASSSIVDVRQRPTLIAVDSDRGYMCRYAKLHPPKEI